VCAPDGHECEVEQALRDRVAHLEAERGDLLAVIARHQGLTRMPGAVETAHPDDAA
jgi:hypothetical protein